MESYYSFNVTETPLPLEESISGKLKMLLQSEEYERGEAIEDVLTIASSYKRVLDQCTTLRNSDNSGLIFWHLEILIQESINMKSNPKKDLFLYLKALYAFKDAMKSNFHFLNISVA